MNNVYCNNCGNEGHLYRQCRLPVLSYGVICINKQNKILMIRRKDSLAYIEFLRGKYKIDDLTYILKLLNGCSVDERKLLQNNSFDELWDKLWFSGTQPKIQTERMIKEHKQSKQNLEQLQKTHLNKLFKECSLSYETPEWEFPKGRRSNHENNMKCAVREFEEETDVSREEYILLENVSPISEEYIGSNNVRYKHIYYLALYKGQRDLSINTDKYEQYSEIGDIAWLTVDECYAKIRKEQSTKSDVIRKIDEFSKRWKHDFILKE